MRVNLKLLSTSMLLLSLFLNSCDNFDGRTKLAKNAINENLSTSNFSVKILEIDKFKSVSFVNKYDNFDMYAYEFRVLCQVQKPGYVLINKEGIVTNLQIFEYDIWNDTDDFLKSALSYVGSLKVNVGDVITCQSKVIMKNEGLGWRYLRISEDLY